MGKILVEGIRLYAYHGCLQEESVIGGKFSIDVSVEADLSKSEISDKIKDTIDYVKIHEIVKQEMAIRSNLIEHVARRIIKHLKSSFQNIQSVEVKVTKLNPPIGGNVEKVSTVISE